jgi:bifunctional DNA-binding transcriptional regulator/antitoxin component of YhaV-PrlF toxin-antitoxin module
MLPRAPRRRLYRFDKVVKQMSKVSSKHQVTIPVRVLREAGLTAGDDVVIRAAGRGRIELERAEDLIRRYAGSLPAGTYPAGYLHELRGEWRASP